MKVFTDDEMNALLPSVRPYSVAILRARPQLGTEGSEAIIWEHGRRTFGLRNDGVMAIVLPVADGSEICGICVLTGTVEETTAIMNDDPGVRAWYSPSRCTPAAVSRATPCRRGIPDERRCLMRILVVGAGVIGSGYAGRLLEAGHSVALCARGRRLAELRDRGLILEDANTGHRMNYAVPVVATPEAAMPCDVVFVAVRRDQMLSALPALTNVDGDVVFFGNAAGLTAQLADGLGDRALFGFPAAGGVRDGAAVRYVLIRQQKTMLADPYERRSPRVRTLSRMLGATGFPVRIATDAEAWLTAHAAFVVPIAFALYRTDVQPRRLAGDDALLTTMVRATRQAFRALQAVGNTEIPRNLRALYLLMPERFAVRYWRNTLAGPRGELWFAAHTRTAPGEMGSLADALRSAVDRSGRRAPDLEILLTSPPA